ncbi:MAG: adenosylcobinamide-phosphate synthase CbiB [Pseudomonadota bacterium]
MVFAALILDALLGEPPALWSRVRHPVVLIGDMIAWLDRELNKGTKKRWRGVFALWLVIVGVLIPTLMITWLPFGWIVEILLGAVLLAHRSLVQHVAAVATSLRHSLTEGRGAVAQIVGRDPDALDEAGVARAAIESAAENFSDGVVAPAFWFLIAGLPGIAIYKAVNTADSMIGYRTEKYRNFGWASARLDDLLNWIPARITAMLFLVIGRGLGRTAAVIREAPLHKSVNAGWPEAALAYVLDIALAGPRSYPGGVEVNDPFVNAAGRKDLVPDDIDQAVRLLWRTWAALLILASIAALVALL